MAKKVFDEKIDRYTDWGGDESTGGLKVSGRSVQEFIKETFDKKAGVFHYDDTNNRYLVFADEEARDEYMENPTNVELILGSFDAPFNYSAEIKLASPTYNSILLGTKNNYLQFSFDTYNKQGQSVGEDVICTYTFIRGSNKKVVTEKYRHGSVVNFNIDKYLSEGTNSITVAIVGQNTLAATTVGITFQVVNLKLSDTYDVSTVYDLYINPEAKASIQYSIDGYGTKVLEWYVDGVKLDFVKTEDEVLEVATSRTKYIDLSLLDQGVHRLHYRAYVVINGEKFYSNILLRELIVYKKSNSNPIIAISAEIPLEYGLDFPEVLTLNDLTQYIPYSLKFSVFNPANPAFTETVFDIDGATVSRMETKNREEYIFNLRPSHYGLKTLLITAETSSRRIFLNIKKSSTSLEDITDGLQLDLLSLGKTNNDSDKDIWQYESYQVKFNNFNWNQSSGWSEGRLIIPSSSSIDVNISPLKNDVTSTGKTLEFEFSTVNVSDESAVICDLIGSNGAGLLITASEAKLVSSGKSEVNTKFKSEDNNRISFVINRKSGVVDKGLIFIYINGVLSGAQTFAATDNFLSDKLLKIGGSSGADVKLKALRFYDSALNKDQILNNYMLYRDTTNEMLSIYDKNDIYEEGTQNFSVDKLSAQLPVMIVTGDVPTLENTNDKNETIYVDIQYINMQDPTKSFTSKGTRMRPQGTSSMGYPKKNFRIYTNYGEMFDNLGNKIVGGKYAMRDDSQPVDCWCFKADYAESSGTHNTGIARLWNQIMYNAQINGEYLLRTEAQKAAIANGFNQDVRTTVDGFPMLMFYRLNEQSDLIFIGKYNFNNDKSTESVFGFRDIPGFDNKDTQCLEILNNGNKHALFQTMEDFDSEWEEAYEFRYNEKNPDIRQIKDFSEWCVSTRHSDETTYSGNITINAELRPEKNGTYPDNAANRQLKFEMEKWDRLDVHKVAAYYIYLMRFGAVDQVVKNAMFTTEGSQGKGTKAKWFFINYDNDTINGVRNDGLLKYGWNIDRQSIDDSYVGTVYAYAGHESTLWNNLEADAEFMSIVSEVDNALFISGLSYANTIKMFNEEQSSKWNERIYNQDAQYKYIGPYNDLGTNNLFMLQGTRSAHRKWWLSNRFDLIDSKHVSGAYKSKMIELKVANAPSGLRIGITSGKKLYYGYGLNNVPIETRVELSPGQSHNFITKQVINVGDPIRIYSAVNIQGLDLSGIAPYLSTVNLTEVWNETSGTRLKTLILGGNGIVNTSLNLISGLSQAKRLETLDITGYRNLYDVPLDGLSYLKHLYAYSSGLTSASFNEGSLIETAQLPSGIKSIVLDKLPYLSSDKFSIENNAAQLSSIFIRNCPLLDTYNFLMGWYDNKTTEDSMTSLEVWDINWVGVPTENILKLNNIKKVGGVLSLNGKIKISDFNLENYYKIIDAFGISVSDPKNSLYIYGEGSGAFVIPQISDPNKYYGGNTYQFSYISFIENTERAEYMFINSQGVEFQTDGYATIDRQTGVMTTKERSYSSDYKVGVKVFNTAGRFQYAYFEFKLGTRSYPNNPVIIGEANIRKVGNYFYNFEYTPIVSDPENPSIGDWDVVWTVAGDMVNEGEVTVVSSGKSGLVLNVNTISLTGSTASIRVEIRRKFDNGLNNYATKVIQTLVEGVLFTKINQAELMKKFWDGGYTSSADFMTVDEAKFITTLPDNFLKNLVNTKTFNEFESFENLTAFNFSGGRFTEITLPPNATVLLNTAFFNCYNLTTINGFENIIEFGSSCLQNCTAFKKDLVFKSGVLYKFNNASFSNSGVQSVVLPQTVDGIYPDNLFSSCKELKRVDFSQTGSVVKLGGNFFTNCVELQELIGTDKITELNGDYIFSSCKKLTGVISLTGLKKQISQYGGLLSGTNYSEVILGKNFSFRSPKIGFHQGSALEKITISAENSEYKSINGIVYNSSENTIVCFPPKYKGAPEGEFVTPTSVKTIADYCFQEVTLTELIVSEGMTEIGIGAFKESSIDKIDLPSTFTFRNASVGDYFSYSLAKEIIIRGALTFIPVRCFEICAALETLTLFDISKLIEIKSSAFNGCSKLKNADFVSNVKTFGSSAFSGCKSLESFTFSDTITAIPDYFLSNCTSLKNLVLPSVLNTIGRMAFGGCSSLESVDLPSTLTTLGLQVFASCTSLKTVVLKEGLTSMNSSCFENCTSLESISFPSTLATIPYNTLYKTLKVKRLYFNREASPTIDPSAFGSTSSASTTFCGYSTKDDEITNKAYIKTNATGYTEGDGNSLANLVSISNFEIIKTL